MKPSYLCVCVRGGFVASRLVPWICFSVSKLRRRFKPEIIMPPQRMPEAYSVQVVRTCVCYYTRPFVHTYVHDPVRLRLGVL